MTTTQRNKHVDSINNIIEQAGFEKNRFGVYHKGKLKIDTRETNIKVWRGEFKTISKPLVSVTLEEMQQIINRILS